MLTVAALTRRQGPERSDGAQYSSQASSERLLPCSTCWLEAWPNLTHLRPQESFYKNLYD